MPKQSGKINEREREICARLKQFREGILWPQPDFAALTGVSLDRLASIEYGRTPLRYDLAWKIQFLFGLNLSWLARGTFGPNEKDLERWPEPKQLLKPASLLSEIWDELQIPGSPLLRLVAKSKRERASPQHRSTTLSILKDDLTEWIARVPDDGFSDFTSQLVMFAEDYLAKMRKESAAKISERHTALIWETMRLDIARRLTAKNATGNNLLVNSPTGVSQVLLDTSKSSTHHGAVKAKICSLDDLLKAVRAKVSERGQKSALARELGVSRQAIDQWFSGDAKPSAELVFELLNRV